jgi:hypothetical protein
MRSTKSKIETYHLLKPRRFNLLKRLDLTQTTVGREDRYELSLSLELVSASDPTGTEGVLVLSFDGVRKLQLKQADWSAIQFPLLEIRDISTRQWEELSYEVVDNEDGVLSLVCRDFSASVR